MRRVGSTMRSVIVVLAISNVKMVSYAKHVSIKPKRLVNYSINKSNKK